MKFRSFLSILIVFVVTCDKSVWSQSCSSPDLPFGSVLYYPSPIKTLQVGHIASFTISNAVNATLLDGGFVQYFSTTFENDVLNISTTNFYENYEMQQNEINPGFGLEFACTSGQASVTIIFTIEETNNYAPEFTKNSYEITVPTPLPTGFDITYFLADGIISATDFDLYGNEIIFEITGSDLFGVEPIVDISKVKHSYQAKLITRKNILQISGDEMTVELKATDTSNIAPKSSTVFIKIISDPNNKFEGELPTKFEQSFYQGTFYEIGENLTMPDITFNADNYNNNISFTLSGFDAENFDFIQLENVVEIKVKAETEKIMEKAFYSFEVVANENDTKIASSNILISTIAAPVPNFDKNFYQGTLNQTNLSHDEIKVDDSNVKVSLDDSTYFNISITGMDVKVILKPGAVIPENRQSFALTLTVENIETGRKSEASLFILVEVEFEAKLEFSSQLYEGTISKTFELSYDPITLNTDNFTIIITGRDANHFDAVRNGISVTLSLINIDEIPSDVAYLQITLTATAENFLSSQSLAILALEREASNEDRSQPYFDTKFYYFSILNEEKGNIGSIQAFVPDGSTPTYDLLFSENSLFGKLTIEGNNLILNETLSTGTYTITAFAFNAQKNATTTIILRVLQKTCEGDLVTHVEKTLAIQKLPENHVFDEIMSSRIGECEYEIFGVSPAALRSKFAIDTSSHYLKSIDILDREAQDFSGQLIPQVQIILKLNCNESSRLIQPWFGSDLITDEILFSTDKTHLNIIILDENDNAPIFTYPSETNYKIGFPEESLVELIMPPYLIKLEAFDADEGINAKIKFSIENSSNFDINAESGVVYPTQKMTSDSTILSIKATDKDGASDGLFSTLTLEVFKLKSDSIVKMIANLKADEAQSFVDDLSTKTNLDIRLINHAPIPTDIDTASKQLSDVNDGKLIIYSYAFDATGNVLKAQDLINELIAVNSEIKFLLIETKEEAPQCESQSIAGWIAAVVVLSILLVIFMVAPLIYVFWYKKNLIVIDQRRISESSSAKEIQENLSVGQSTPIPNTEVQSQTAEGEDAEEHVGEQANEIVEEPSTSDADRLNNRLLSILDDDADDRKNVSFKEYVERIEVLQEQK